MFDQRPLGVMTVRFLGFLHGRIYKGTKLCSNYDLQKNRRWRTTGTAVPEFREIQSGLLQLCYQLCTRPLLGLLRLPWRTPGAWRGALMSIPLLIIDQNKSDYEGFQFGTRWSLCAMFFWYNSHFWTVCGYCPLESLQWIVIWRGWRTSKRIFSKRSSKWNLLVKVPVPWALTLVVLLVSHYPINRVYLEL